MYTECIYMQMRLQPATHSGSLLSLVAPPPPRLLLHLPPTPSPLDVIAQLDPNSLKRLRLP